MRLILFVFSFVQISILFAQMPPDEFSFTTTNSSGTLLGQVQISGVYADDDDWIAAFDESGICCGAAQIINFNGVSYINLSIYGDDGTTLEVDEGINNGESFTLKLFDASANLILDYELDGEIVMLENWTNTNGAPMPNYSNTEDIYLFTSLQVSFNQSISVCENQEGIILTGGFPEGGEYSGTGVVGGVFYADVAQSGTHEIIYSLNTQEASINAIVHEVFEPEIYNEGPFCNNGDEVSLEATIEGGIFTGQGVVNNSFSPNLLTAGTYSISYEVTDSNLCELSSTALFEVFQSPELDIIVNDGYLTANVILGNPTNFMWNTNEASSEINTEESGTYWLIGSDANCNSDTVFVDVEIAHNNIIELNSLNFYFSNNKIIFNPKDNNKGVLTVFSLHGKIVKHFNVENTSVIDLNVLPKGLYVLNFMNRHQKKSLVIKI